MTMSWHRREWIGIANGSAGPGAESAGRGLVTVHVSLIRHSPFTSHTSRFRRFVICLDDADLHAPELHGGALTIGFEDLELDTLKYPRAANVRDGVFAGHHRPNHDRLESAAGERGFEFGVEGRERHDGFVTKRHYGSCG